jgi:hypothetical protein
MKLSLPILAAVFLASFASVSTCIAADGARNPFGVQDVSNPNGEDVQAFAQNAKLPTDKNDANAAQWAENATAGKSGLLDGEWSSRWGGGNAGDNWKSGTATVRTVGDRVYILYKDRTDTYLIDTVRNGNRLVGRYMNIGQNSDTTPWFGIIVDDERIDGIWTQGRWDLRRQLAHNPGKTPADNSHETLEEQVKDLRRHVRELEERLSILEGHVKRK